MKGFFNKKKNDLERKQNDKKQLDCSLEKSKQNNPKVQYL